MSIDKMSEIRMVVRRDEAQPNYEVKECKVRMSMNPGTLQWYIVVDGGGKK